MELKYCLCKSSDKVSYYTKWVTKYFLDIFLNITYMYCPRHLVKQLVFLDISTVALHITHTINHLHKTRYTYLDLNITKRCLDKHLVCLQMQSYITVCPGSSEPIYIVSDQLYVVIVTYYLYKMGYI